ncbi:MAG TPA: TonB family protein [Sphingomicrobium sp.]|nr:TonB family protein [Sphingomicrobium sp.]
MMSKQMNFRAALIAAAGLAGLAAAGPAHAVDPAWQKKVAKLIGDNYSYPRSAQLRGEQGNAKIKVAISGAGKVLSVDLVQSSGSAILDREAVRIPMKVSAYPAPPTGSTTNVIFPITWRISDQ